MGKDLKALVVKAVSVICIASIVATLGFFSAGKISQKAFWIVVAFSAFVAYVLVPMTKTR